MGQEVRELLYADGDPNLRGYALGSALTDVLAREGECRRDGNALRFSIPLEDPHGTGRLVELTVHAQQDRVRIVSARFYSADKIDVDAAYRAIREHLDGLVGKPERKLGGALTLVWTIPGAYEGRTHVSHYKDDQQRAVLDISTRPADGVRFEGRKPNAGST